MFQRQRRAEILDTIEREGHVVVDELASRYDVSVESIRKDLQALVRAGKCQRVYGGAVRLDGSDAAGDTTGGAQERDTHPLAGAFPTKHVPDCAGSEAGRLAVAKRAFMEINDGDSIFLDVSRTNVLLAGLLAQSDKHVILTTNMIDVMRAAANHPNITALSTGGFLNQDLTGFVGSATVSLLEPILFSKAFVGANGIDLDRNAVLAESFDDGAVKSRVVQNASFKFLLADEEKFGRQGLYRFASLNDFEGVITDTQDPEVLEKLQRRGVPALQAYRTNDSM